MKENFKIILLALICFILGTSEYVIVGVLDKIAESSNITISQAGQLISVFALTVSIGTPVLIYFTSKIDQRKLLTISLVLVVASCVMMAISSTYALLLLSRIFMAIGVGVFNVLCFIIATRLASPDRKSSAVATVTLGFNAALIIGLPIGRTITAMFGWKAIFIFTAVLSFLSIFAILKLVPPFESDKPISFRDQLKLLSSSSIIFSLLTSLFWILGYGLLYSYITPYLQHTVAMPESMLSVTFVAFGIATLVGNKFGGYLGDKIGVLQTISFSLVANVSALIMLTIFSHSVYATFSLFIFWGFAAWIPGPLLRYRVISLAPGSAGVILSLYNSIVQFGLATGAALGGLEIHEASPSVLTWSAAIVISVSLMFSFLSSRQMPSKNQSVKRP